jgi:hypothetical protein
VATMADLEPYFCALFAREATPVCPSCGEQAVHIDPVSAAERAAAKHEGAMAMVTYRVPVAGPEQFLEVRETLLADGYRRLLIGGEARDLDEIKPSEVIQPQGSVEVVVDRVRVASRDKRRLGAAIEQAFQRTGASRPSSAPAAALRCTCTTAQEPPASRSPAGWRALRVRARSSRRGRGCSRTSPPPARAPPAAGSGAPSASTGPR